VRHRIEAALVAFALLGAPVATVAPAAAQVQISINPGSIAYGYSDGYWDRNHHWHPWANENDRNWYRSHYAGHYYDRRHDREPEQGWRNSDRWWEHH